MKLFLFLGIALAACSLVMTQSDCAMKAQQCMEDYVKSAVSFRTQAEICGGAETYIKCFKAACGTIPNSVVQTMEDKIGAAGIHCDLHA